MGAESGLFRGRFPVWHLPGPIRHRPESLGGRHQGEHGDREEGLGPPQPHLLRAGVSRAQRRAQNREESEIGRRRLRFQEEKFGQTLRAGQFPNRYTMLKPV